MGKIVLGENLNLGKIIKEAREKKQWSQLSLATEIGIKQSTLSKYERGKTTLPTEVAQKILEILGLQMKIVSTKELSNDSRGKKESSR